MKMANKVYFSGWLLADLWVLVGGGAGEAINLYVYKLHPRKFI